MSTSSRFVSAEASCDREQNTISVGAGQLFIASRVFDAQFYHVNSYEMALDCIFERNTFIIRTLKL